MSNEPVLSPRQAEEQRTRVVDALTEHFAQDNLTMEQLERRLEQVYAASTASALTAVLEGLPSLAPQGTVPATTAQSAPPVRAEEGMGGRTLVAVMSGITRRGDWRVPRQLNLIAFMGGMELDFRHARLTAAVTEINILAVMGGVQVTVPPGVRIESEGFAIMGGFEDAHGQSPPTDPNAPVIRLKGFALMGGVEVRVLESELLRS